MGDPRKKSLEKEFDEIKSLSGSPGIEDLIAVYGEYQNLMQIASQYLRETAPRFTFSVSDRSS